MTKAIQATYMWGSLKGRQPTKAELRAESEAAIAKALEEGKQIERLPTQVPATGYMHFREQKSRLKPKPVPVRNFDPVAEQVELEAKAKRMKTLRDKTANHRTEAEEAELKTMEEDYTPWR